jgi:uncharacterized membrane protein YbaN (DUF454 family)
MRRIGKSLWVVSGTVCIGLAIFGNILAVFADHPFYLLAAFLQAQI